MGEVVWEQNKQYTTVMDRNWGWGGFLKFHGTPRYGQLVTAICTTGMYIAKELPLPNPRSATAQHPHLSRDP